MRKMVALAVVAFVGLTASTPITALAADELTEIAHKALIDYTQATLDGPKVLAPMLMPEFQIMRSNGVGYDRDGYLGRSVARISAKPEFSHEEIVATRHGDILVIRYFLRIDETIEGQKIKARAPRLTVFRLVDGEWKVVAHSNFGAPQK